MAAPRSTAKAMPVRSAAPWPQLIGWRRTQTGKASAASEVESLEPSSTTTTSACRGQRPRSVAGSLLASS